ncbi:MAG: Uma2 family endonuclease [Ruminococcus sp.]
MEKAKAKQKSYCDSNIKEEKINGVTYTIPKSEAYQHGIVAGNISTIIHYGLSKGSLVFTGNLDYRYHPAVNDDYVVPDVLVVHDRKNLRDTYYCGIPKFVVEIVSPATVLHDRKDKLKIYRKQMFKNIGLYHQWNGLLRFIIW